MSTSDRDAALVAAYLAGDQQAFATLFCQYAPAIYQRAYAITMHASDADDVTQETFLRAYYALGQFDQRGSLLAWLSRIAVNLCFKQYRRQTNALAREAIHTSPAPLPASTEEGYVTQEYQAAMTQAIATLPPQQRAVFVLRFREHLSYRAIGAAVHCSEGAARAHMFHAIQHIRHTLASWAEGTS